MVRVVLVHGFSQSGSAWTGVLRHLVESGPGGLDVVTPDVPDDLDFAGTAGVLAADWGPAVFCGYSMGGRLCLRAALDAPELVRGLVMVSASPGIVDAADRAARAEADDELAREVERDGVEAFLRRWLSQPLFATLPRPAAEEASRRAPRTSVGRLQHQLRALGQGGQEPLWDRLPELSVPLAVVTGTADRRYGVVGDRVAALVPGAVRVRVDGGHALPLEAPGAVADAVLDVVRAVGGGQAHVGPV